MKKLILLLLLFKAFQCEAQSNIKESIDLKDSVINRSIPFKVERGTNKLEYYAQGYLTNGQLSVSLTDPDGKESGEFQLETGRNNSNEKKSAKGTVSNSKSSPMPGLWKMNIRVDNGTGRISYQIYLKP